MTTCFGFLSDIFLYTGTTLSICPGLGLAPNVLACIPSGMVAKKYKNKTDFSFCFFE